jgi:hypothetical protein
MDLSIGQALLSAVDSATCVKIAPADRIRGTLWGSPCPPRHQQQGDRGYYTEHDEPKPAACIEIIAHLALRLERAYAFLEFGWKQFCHGSGPNRNR